MKSHKPPIQDEILAWMNSAGRYKILSNEETLRIAKKIKECEVNSKEYHQLINKLTVHNLRLVIKYVTSFMRTTARKKFGGQDTIDYLQVGVIGLRRGIELYNPYSGFKLSTYVYPWIRSYVGRYNIKSYSSVHITENAINETWKFNRLGFIPDKNGGKKDMEATIQLVDNVRAAMSVMSLDATVEQDPGCPMPFSSLIESKYKQIENGKFTEEIEDMIESCGLTDLQVEILRAIYLDQMKISKISKIHNLEQGKVRKLKESALNSLRELNGLV